MEEKFYVYKITNLITKRVYIGKTNDLSKRWSSHLSTKDGTYIHNSIKKHGKKNFKLDIIEEVSGEDNVYEREIYFIALFKANEREFGYNLTIGGRGVITNKPVSLITRKKISDAQIGVKRRTDYTVTDETRQKLSLLGKMNKNVLPIEIKKRIYEMYSTGEYTQKDLANLFNIKKETVRYIVIYHRLYGFKTEEEMHMNRSVAKKGKKLSSEHKLKVSKGNLGRKVSEDTADKIAKSLSGRKISEEQKELIRQANAKQDHKYRIPIETKQKVIELFKTGKYNGRQIAEIVGLKHKTVGKIILKYKKKLNKSE